MSFRQLLLSALLGVAVPMVSACGGSAPKMQTGPDHFYSRLRAGEPSTVAGTYRVSGTFAGDSSDGSTLLVEQSMEKGMDGSSKPSTAISVKRTAADGHLLAIGTGTLMGDQLYVAWQMGPAEQLLAHAQMVLLYVFDLEPAAFEGFALDSTYSPLSGEYGGQTSPATLAVQKDATYHLAQQDYGHADIRYDLSLRRYADQFLTTLSSSGKATLTGTSILGGDTRLAAAVLSENQKDIPQLAIGVYTVANGSISGRSVFMDNTDQNEPPHGGMGGTLKLPSEPEQWTLAPADGAAPAPAAPAAASGAAQ